VAVVTLHRVTWQLGNATGSGPWHSSASLRSLNRVVGELNRRYGRGTHRIESRDVRDAELLIEAAVLGAT
jgi:hypothetical protein